MNITLNLLNIKPLNNKYINKHVANKQTVTSLPIFDNNGALALKNQILFQGNLQKERKELVEETNKKYDLGINPEIFCSILNSWSINSSYKERKRVGELALKASINSYLAQQYKEKDGQEIEKIAASYLSYENLNRVSKSLFPEKLLQKNNEEHFLSVILGAIIIDGEKDGNKNFNHFLENEIIPIIKPENLIIEQNSYEVLEDYIAAQGKNPSDLHLEMRLDDNGIAKYKLYYKDLLLSNKDSKDDTLLSRKEAKEFLIQEAVGKISAGKVNFDDACDELPYQLFNVANEKRKEDLQELANSLGLEFNDINLLHQVFLYGSMPDGTILGSRNPLRTFSFIGTKVLEGCLGIEILKTQSTDKEANNQLNQTVNNSKLADLARKMNLDKYALSQKDFKKNKVVANLFTALLGAIYLDDKDNGIQNVYNFLDKNCSKEIFNRENSTSFDSLLKTFFPKDVKKHDFKDTLEKYNLGIYPETFEYIANTKNIDNAKYNKYFKKGEELFELFLRAELCKEFPHNNEGVFTRLVQQRLMRYEYISKIPKELFEKEFNSTSEFKLSRKFLALLGAMVVDGEEKGYQNTLQFLDEHVKPLLNLDDFANKESKKENIFEAFKDYINELGLDIKDFEFQNKVHGGARFVCTIYYKNNKLVQTNQTRSNIRATREEAICTLFQKIANQEIDLENYAWQEKTTVDYTKPDEKRKESLRELCKKLNLEFNDINLLHRAFLARSMPDGTIISNHKSYQLLEYIGDAVLKFCAHEFLSTNLSNSNNAEINKKLKTIISNKNLIEFAEKFGLNEYIITNDNLREKSEADTFEALIGAIYLDGGIQGLDNAYKFLEENFKDEILSI